MRTPTISALLALAGAAACSGSAAAQATAILREGDPVGLSTASAINNTAVNGGRGYAITVNTADGIAHVWGNLAGGDPAIIRSEGFFDGVTQTAYETFFGIGTKHVAYSPTGPDGPFGSYDSVFRDDSIVMLEGEPHPILQGQFWRFGSRPNMTDDGDVWFVGGLTDTAGGSTQSRGLFVGGNADDVVIRSGDMVPGFGGAAINTGTAVDFDFRVSRDGSHYIAPIVLVATTSTDAGVVIDSQAAVAGPTVLREGNLIPVSVGGNGTELYANFDFMGITSDGRWMVTGDSNAATSADEFLMLDGQIVLRDGMAIGPDTVQGDIEGAYLNDNADYAAVWDINANTLEVLLVNGQIVLREGDQVDWNGDGVADPDTRLTDFTVISTLTLSNRHEGTVDVYFTADVSVGGAAAAEAFFRLRVNVEGPPACACDWNADTFLNSQDFFDFLTDFFADDADFNNDKTTNSQDYFDFLTCFFEGC